MGIFNKNKERMDLIQKTQENLDLSQKNTEQMLKSLMQINTINTEEEKFDETYQLQAAYALNLCSVSVSQIVDYNDIYILEQEYELILNNLNIENMPKDEALLNILKQILDTITFFKIQEGDKKFIQNEYQEKMKSAIWSAVPNIGAIVAGGSPVAMAMSLASQVGIGYMNYRKEKARTGLELERQKWQLQRSAIEQFHGLRRELFDTAWRLADKYEFPDNYRLTENQITLYNEILMESHLIRKYERLFAIKENFKAYPSFLYQIGNAANDIYQSNKYDDDIKDRYKQLAMSYFEEYLNINKYDLLRANQIASSCALEYIDLLDVNNDRGKIEELLDYAIKSSGDANDILELCAIEYLKLGNSQKASILLKRLVNESYNTIINAQMLSSIYVSDYIKNPSTIIKTNYKLLGELVAQEYLFPLPKVDENIEDLESLFLSLQKQILVEKYMKVLKQFTDMYTIKFNKTIPLPKNEVYSDYFYSDEAKCRTVRFNKIKKALEKVKSRKSYIEDLKEVDIEIIFLDILNKMYFDMIKLRSINSDDTEIMKRRLKDAYITKKKELDEFRQFLESSNAEHEKIYQKLSSFTFKSFAKEFFMEVVKSLNSYMDTLNQVNDLMFAEGILRTFCISQNIPVPERLYSQNTVENNTIETYIFEESLGTLEEMKEKKELKSEMQKCIEDGVISINENNRSKKKVKFISTIKTHKEEEILSAAGIDKKKFLGYIDDKKTDLYFTTEKLHIIGNVVNKKSSAFYNEIEFDGDERIYSNGISSSTTGNSTVKNDIGIRQSVEEVAKAAAAIIMGPVATGAVTTLLSMNKKKEFEYTKTGNVNVSKLYDLIKKLHEINPKVTFSDREYSENELNFATVDKKEILNNDTSVISFIPTIVVE